MYEELVKELRKESCGAKTTSWWRAADAIEKLVLELDKASKPMTNADRIRQMTDEELAKWICDISDCPYCPGKELDCRVGKSGIMTGALDWLKAKVEEKE